MKTSARSHIGPPIFGVGMVRMYILFIFHNSKSHIYNFHIHTYMLPKQYEQHSGMNDLLTNFLMNCGITTHEKMLIWLKHAIHAYFKCGMFQSIWNQLSFQKTNPKINATLKLIWVPFDFMPICYVLKRLFFKYLSSSKLSLFGDMCWIVHVIWIA